jgi:hypothetical protein
MYLVCTTSALLRELIISTVTVPITGPILRSGFTIDQFRTARAANTIATALHALGMIAESVDKIPPSKLPAADVAELKNVVFIVANTYEAPSRALGPAPLNNSIAIAYYLSLRGYRKI